MLIEPTTTQCELWHLDKYAGAGEVLCIPHAWRIRGEVNTSALSAAIDVIVGRHEALRTAIREDDGVPMIEVMAPRTGVLKVTEPADQMTADAELTTFLRSSLDLGAGRCFAAILQRRSAGEQILLLNAHHAMIDAWSFGMIEAELGSGYRSALQHDPLDAVPDYRLADVLAESRAHHSSDAAEDSLQFWASRLSGWAGMAALPGGQPRDQQRGYRSAEVTREIEATVLSDLARQARATGTTLFASLLAAYAGTLARWMNADDLVLGIPVADRPTELSRQSVNFSTAVAPIRLAPRGNPAFADLVAVAGEQISDAIAHSAAPLSRIAQRLGLRADADINTLTEFAVTHRVNRGVGLTIEDASVERFTLRSQRSLYQLSCHFVQDDDGMSFELAGRALTEPQLNHLADRLQAVLEAVAREPGLTISAWPVAMPEDVAHNGRPTTSPRGTAVDQFLAIADRYPDDSAILGVDRRVTYAELRQDVEATSAALVSAGVGVGDIVAVCTSRDAGLSTALLATMHAGAVYLPIDPTWPAQRVRVILADAACRTAIVDASTAGHAGLDGLHRLTVATGPCPESPAPRGIAGDAAYLLYTSGSTGKPKGVIVEHRSLVHILTEMAALLGVCPGQRVLASTTATFDISFIELLMPLTVGATSVVADADTVQDPARLGLLIKDLQIDVVQGTPTLLGELSQHIVGSLPVILCGGERLSEVLRDRLLSIADRVFNGYGPTEATIYSCVSRLDPTGPVAIGVPVPGTTAHVLDKWGRPCAAGAVGRLFLGGAGLARGYMRDSDLTAMRFVAGPESDGRGRMYDSGDLASWGPDGQLYFHGREDDQIKIRGFRVEIGEVESLISAVPGVTACSALPIVRGQNQHTLVAFVSAPDTVTEGAELEDLLERVRSALAEALPGPVCPREVHHLGELPLTSSGKVDRVTLSRMALRERPRARKLTSGTQKTNLQLKLCELVAELVGVSSVEPDDNFFDLGGDSIGAARVLARARKLTNAQLRYNDFAGNPTVRALEHAVIDGIGA